VLRRDGRSTVLTGDHAKEDAIDYAKAGAKLGHGEIRVLKHDELVESVIRV